MAGMFSELFCQRQAFLVTAASRDKANVTAVEWITPVSEKPPTVAFSLRNTSLTLEIACASMEFVVAVPPERMRDAVALCGATSGKYIDKFSEARLTQVKAKRVSAPLVLEAAANLECRLLNYTSAGDHTLVTGEVVEAHMPKDDPAFEPLVFRKGEKPLFAIRKDGGQ